MARRITWEEDVMIVVAVLALAAVGIGYAFCKVGRAALGYERTELGDGRIHDQGVRMATFKQS